MGEGAPKVGRAAYDNAELEAAEARAEELKERFAFATDDRERQEAFRLASEATLRVNTMRAVRECPPSIAKRAADEASRSLKDAQRMLEDREEKQEPAAASPPEHEAAERRVRSPNVFERQSTASNATRSPTRPAAAPASTTPSRRAPTPMKPSSSPSAASPQGIRGDRPSSSSARDAPSESNAHEMTKSPTARSPDVERAAAVRVQRVQRGRAARERVEALSEAKRVASRRRSDVAAALRERTYASGPAETPPSARHAAAAAARRLKSRLEAAMEAARATALAEARRGSRDQRVTYPGEEKFRERPDGARAGSAKPRPASAVSSGPDESRASTPARARASSTASPSRASGEKTPPPALRSAGDASRASRSLRVSFEASPVTDSLDAGAAADPEATPKRRAARGRDGGSDAAMRRAEAAERALRAAEAQRSAAEAAVAEARAEAERARREALLGPIPDDSESEYGTRSPLKSFASPTRPSRAARSSAASSAASSIGSATTRSFAERSGLGSSLSSSVADDPDGAPSAPTTPGVFPGDDEHRGPPRDASRPAAPRSAPAKMPFSMLRAPLAARVGDAREAPSRITPLTDPRSLRPAASAAQPVSSTRASPKRTSTTERAKAYAERVRAAAKTAAFLRAAEIFPAAEVADGDLKALARALERVEAAPGDRIVTAGDVARGVFFVREGRAEVFAEARVLVDPDATRASRDGGVGGSARGALRGSRLLRRSTGTGGGAAGTPLVERVRDVALGTLAPPAVFGEECLAPRAKRDETTRSGPGDTRASGAGRHAFTVTAACGVGVTVLRLAPGELERLPESVARRILQLARSTAKAFSEAREALDTPPAPPAPVRVAFGSSAKPPPSRVDAGRRTRDGSPRTPLPRRGPPAGTDGGGLRREPRDPARSRSPPPWRAPRAARGASPSSGDSPYALFMRAETPRGDLDDENFERTAREVMEAALREAKSAERKLRAFREKRRGRRGGAAGGDAASPGGALARSGAGADRPRRANSAPIVRMTKKAAAIAAKNAPPGARGGGGGGGGGARWRPEPGEFGSPARRSAAAAFEVDADRARGALEASNRSR